MRSETGVSWLDAAVSKANVPQTVDTETAIEIHLRITGEELSNETYRRLPVPYRLIGRERRYTVDDVVAYAKQRFEQAPVRRSCASVTRRRPQTEARHREAPPPLPLIQRNVKRRSSRNKRIVPPVTRVLREMPKPQQIRPHAD